MRKPGSDPRGRISSLSPALPLTGSFLQDLLFQAPQDPEAQQVRAELPGERHRTVAPLVSCGRALSGKASLATSPGQRVLGPELGFTESRWFSYLGEGLPGPPGPPGNFLADSGNVRAQCHLLSTPALAPGHAVVPGLPAS